MPGYAIGAMRDTLVIQQQDPALAIVSITRSGTVATVTTLTAHGRASGDFMQVAATVPTGYNGRVKITVTGLTTFTYTVSDALATPATTPGTATYATDAAGGRNPVWSNVATGVAAERVSLSASERLAAEAVQGVETARWRVYANPDFRAGMRVVLTPVWPANAAQQVFGITGIRPVDDDPQFMWIDATRRAA
jgi:hypothetical protein